MKGRFELFTPDHAADAFTVLSFRGREETSHPFAFRLRARAASLDLERELVGSPAVLVIHGRDRSRSIAGLVASARMETVLANGDGAVYRIKLVPRLAALAHTRNSRIFQERSVPQIVAAVLDHHRVDHAWKVRREYPPRTYCVQYQESDLDFVQRLLAEEGIFYAIDTSGEAGEAPRDVVVLADDAAAYEPIPGASALRFHEADGLSQGREAIESLSFRRAVRPGASLLAGFDFRRPQLRLTADASSDAPGAVPQRRVYDHDMDWSKWTLRPEAPRLHLEQHRRGDAVGEGTSGSPRLAPGRTFELEEHPRADLNARFAVVRVEHEGRTPEVGRAGAGSEAEQVYTNRFHCVHADVAARPPRRARPYRQIMETATVVGPPGEDIHTDEHGRVKVQFHWDRDGKGDDRSSCWIRVMTPWAGSAWGAQFLPRVGMEVVVTFAGGDADRPMLLGSVYNGANVPPFPLPAKKTQSGIRTRSTPSGEGGNELRFDDAAGHEQIYLHAQRDLVEVVEHDRVREVRGKESVKVQESRTVDVEKDNVRHVAGSEVVTIDKSFVMHIAGAHVLHVGGETGEASPEAGPQIDAAQGGPGAAPSAEAPATPEEAEAALKQVIARAARRKGAELVWLAEQLPDDFYDEGGRLEETARELSSRVTGLFFEARALSSLAPSPELPSLAKPLEEQLAAVRERLAEQLEDALAPMPPALHRLQSALIEHLTATDRTAASAAEMLSRAKDGEPPPEAADVLGTLRGGGGGDRVFTQDGKAGGQGFSWPENKAKNIPAGQSSGKGSTMTIKNGGTLEAPDGFRIVSGGSKIELTPGGILIDGPVVNVKGSPINLN
jgi:type VI secretion system secreted protein VgrG